MIGAVRLGSNFGFAPMISHNICLTVRIYIYIVELRTLNSRTQV